MKVQDKKDVFLDTIINNLPMMVSVIDAEEQRFVLANTATEQVFGSNQCVIGKSLHDLLPKALADSFAARDHAVIKSGTVAEFEQQYSSAVGKKTFDTKLIPVLNGDGKAEFLISIYEDITEKRKAEQRILFMAHHDCLTGAANRALFYRVINDACADSAHREPFTIIYIDIDNFKSINDFLGHPVGDQVLVAIAQRLSEVVGEQNHVARLGGDEFAVILSGAGSADASETIHRIISAINAPIDSLGRHVRVTASIGVVTAPADGTDADALLINADLALYSAKNQGGDACRFFTKDLLINFQSRCTMESDLRHALDRSEFKLYYQPLISLPEHQIEGFEALLRWDSPSRGLVSPADFIPLAEESGLIGPIGAWVLRQACMDASRWPDDISIAVNVSVAQFHSRSLVFDVTAALAASNLRPSRLQLEITESIILFNTASVIETLRQLRAIGVKIVMDDFGTGYSSLSYLTKFTFDKVKIDQSFIRGIAGQSDSLAVVRAITSLCSDLNIATTAEGVETDAQLQRLKKEGCTEVQGFLLGRPAPVDSVVALLERYGHVGATTKLAGAGK
jgi:diguanylate cyclase (GGDEF)-like protein/PAS domain S-box-containing protein